MDINVQISVNRLDSAVHVKSTNTGDCWNDDSIAPDRCKIGTIETMLHRAYKMCSERTSFYREVNRWKQLYTDNNYPMKIVDAVINRLYSIKLDDATVNSTSLVKQWHLVRLTVKYTPLLPQSNEQQLQARRNKL